MTNIEGKNQRNLERELLLKAIGDSFKKLDVKD